MFNRRGIIRISYDEMKRLEQDPKAQLILSLLFSKFFPFHIDNNFVKGEIVYSGYSPDFEEIEEGYAMPEYEVKMDFHNEDHAPKIHLESVYNCVISKCEKGKNYGTESTGLSIQE